MSALTPEQREALKQATKAALSRTVAKAPPTDVVWEDGTKIAELPAPARWKATITYDNEVIHHPSDRVAVRNFLLDEERPEEADDPRYVAALAALGARFKLGAA